MNSLIQEPPRTDLELLREREAKLEAEVAAERERLEIITQQLSRTVLQLSECKKAIGALTVGKLRTA